MVSSLIIAHCQPTIFLESLKKTFHHILIGRHLLDGVKEGTFQVDWIREIIGEDKDFDLTLLMAKGVDLHSFQPSAEDIRKISTCDVFIYVGGESDEWVGDALKNATNKNMVVVNLLEVIGDKAKPEEHDEHAAENDEHIWLSLKNAPILCEAITDALKKNSAAYKEKLAALEQKYREALSAA